MIEGKWHPAGSAAQKRAVLLMSGDNYQLKTADGISYSGVLDELSISDRIGNIQRKITLPDGSIFSTENNDAVDVTFIKTNKFKRIIHKLESSIHWVFIGIVVTALTAFSFFKWGIPWASDKIAMTLPQKTNELIAVDALKFLDKYIFEKSKIGETRQAQILQHFKEHLQPMGNEEIKYKIHFRAWNSGKLAIPNALALPSGDLVLTDKFIQLAQNQTEIDSVLLHEMGHVEHRHSLEMLIEGTFVAVVVTLAIGDISGVAEMGVGLGTALLTSNYSRNHESEADEYAFKKMLKAGMDPQAFSNIMRRMTDYIDDNLSDKRKKNKPDIVKDKEGSVWDYFSSHPNTNERVSIARQYSKCFHQGKTECKIEKFNAP